MTYKPGNAVLVKMGDRWYKGVVERSYQQRVTVEISAEAGFSAARDVPSSEVLAGSQRRCGNCRLWDESSGACLWEDSVITPEWFDTTSVTGSDYGKNCECFEPEEKPK